MFEQTMVATAVHKPFSLPKKYFWLSILLAVIILLGTFFLGRISANSSSVTQTQQPTPTAKTTINKTFSFPVTNDSGATVATLSYTITDAAEQNQIIIQGEKATAVAGKTFFIVNIKITNPSQQGIQINARDFVRLSLNGSKEQMAADIHNDPVAVQAISTKYTRLGFPINTTDKNFILTVGQINGTKTDIPVTFSSK